jgi:AcrR family transcriptional regulator
VLVNGVHLSHAFSVTPTDTRFLDAAYDALARGGPDAISIRSIAAAARVTAPAFYKHFENKDALIEAVAERGFTLFEHRLRARPFPKKPDAAIASFLSSYITFALEEPHLFEIMFVAPRVRLRRFPSDFASGRSSTFNLLRSLVDSGIARGLFRCDDSLEVTRDLWAFAHGYVALFRAGRFGNDRKALRTAFNAGLVRLLKGLR